MVTTTQVAAFSNEAKLQQIIGISRKIGFLQGMQASYSGMDRDEAKFLRTEKMIAELIMELADLTA